MSNREELLALPIAVPPEGLVPLADKTQPAHLADGTKEDYAFTRAIVDVVPMKEKLLKNPHLFDEAFQSENGQPRVVRPAHDEWGINKIIFVFCDDFLKRVYNFPWFQSQEWRELLDPYFEAIGVPADKIVRCLLAKMPAGSTIPVHHDTGFWVPHTHRVHVPIVTSDQVIFRVGKTPETMKRYSFNEGRIVELNNQAKHAVDNFMEAERIHLIFDYVDDFPLERLILAPGTKLRQTRRSIDLASDAGSRKTPSFLIIGAQKSGTTSLYEYICAHPLVVKGKGRESHYFDWRWNEKLTTPEQHHRYYMGWYEHELLHNHPSLMTGESTPSYMLYSHVTLPRIKEVCPWAKLLVTLRDPVERAYSQYQMMVDPEGTPQQKKNRGTLAVGRTFDEVLDIEMKELEDFNITPTCSREEFVEYVKTRPMNHGGHSILARGMYAHLLQPWLNAYEQDQLLVLFLDDLKSDVQATMERVYDFIGLPPQHVLENKEPQNTRRYDPLSDQTRERLRAFYQPYNEKLRELLGRLPERWN